MPRRLLFLLGCSIAFAAVPATAAFATPSLTRSGGTTLTYNGDGGNDGLTVTDSAGSTVLTPGGDSVTPWDLGGAPGCSQDPGTFVVTCTPGVNRLVFNGASGNDSLDNDRTFLSGVSFNGGTGDDELDNSGSPSAAVAVGGAGLDSLTGGGGSDTLSGDDDNDFVSGLGNVDTVSGNNGADTVLGGAGNDVMRGGAGADVLRGDVGNDDIDGEAGADDLFGDADSDALDGGDGRDDLQGGPGADDLVGAEGFDVARYTERPVGEPVKVDLDDAADDGFGSEGDNAHSDIEDIFGGAGADELIGDGDDNVLDGNAGGDLIEGGGGADTGIGGDGNDVMRFRDGARESVDCGGGTADTIVGDEIDELLDCETRDLSAELTSDVDGDGVAAPTDCNDRNSAIRPNATDTPDNGIDENCDGADAIDFDRDRDGSARPADCDDTNAAVRPGAAEVFANTVDEDCNGVADPFPSITATVVSGFSVLGSRTTVTSLSAKNVPAGATVEVRCSGRGCPKTYRRKVSRRTSSLNLRRAVRRALRAGSRLEVRITRPGHIGRVVRYPIKRGALPVSQTLCLEPGKTRPVEC